jgi:poly(A) polymerase
MNVSSDAQDGNARAVESALPDIGCAPLGQLPPQSWMQAPGLLRLFAAYQQAGIPLMCVGGCVRDALAHRPVQDIDLATPAQPEQSMQILQAIGAKVIPTGLAHGTVTAVVDHIHYEITTLRRDEICDGRHATVAYTDNWREDASRRDLTINALYADAQGRVYDFFDGLVDLSRGQIRFVGRAMQRIEEDLLRAFRFFRFFGRYGCPPYDRDALAACTALAPRLSELSAERVWSELKKILLGALPEDILLTMRGCRMLAYWWPEMQSPGVLRQLVFLESHGLQRPHVHISAYRRLVAAMEPATGTADITALGQRLKLSNDEKRTLKNIHNACQWVESKEKPLHAVLYVFGQDVVRDAVYICWARFRARHGRLDSAITADWITMLDQIDQWQLPVFPITGQDVLAHGVAAGPQVGQLLARIEQHWVDAQFTKSKEDLLALLSCFLQEA